MSLLFLLAIPLLGVPPADRHEPQTYMQTLGFAPGEIADLEAGKVVARVFPEQDDIEASVMGFVRIKAPVERLLDRVRHIEKTPIRDPLMQIGRFSETPRIEDLGPLVFEAEDLDDFSKCRVGACEVQAPDAAADLSRQIDWRAIDAKDKATRLVKEGLLNLTKTYLEEGSSGLVVYHNNPAPLSVRAEVEKLLQNSPNLKRYNPGFITYLLDFPKANPGHVENFVFWEKERLHKPVVSVIHACIERVEDGADVAYFIALKHIYDSRFFFAHMEFLTMIPDGQGFYLIRSVRARIDPPQKLRGFLLGKIKGAMRGALVDELKATKTELEAAH
jgi:hypothetical protein